MFHDRANVRRAVSADKVNPSQRAERAAVIVIAGPTASGKSSLALAVAQEFDGTVINADAMQVYRGLEVVTAQPDAAARARVPHRLYGALDPADPCNAARWCGLARAAIGEAHAAGRLPVVTGGTGLYLRALRRGLASLPAVSPTVRERVRRELETVGHEAFHARLAERDPEFARRVPLGDTQRLIRAAEVVEATGRPLSAWHKDPPDRDRDGLRFFELALLPERAALYEACDRRFLEMMASGVLEEVKRLLARGLDPGLPAMKAVGVAELCRYLQGALARDEAVRLAQQATRRLAKRQTTWIRHQMPEARVCRPETVGQFSQTFLRDLFKKIRLFLLTGR
jgi:tRNA dimethylallyltransferase